MSSFLLTDGAFSLTYVRSVCGALRSIIVSFSLYASYVTSFEARIFTKLSTVESKVLSNLTKLSDSSFDAILSCLTFISIASNIVTKFLLLSS